MSSVQDIIRNDAGGDIILNIEVADTPDSDSWEGTRSFSKNTQDAFKKANGLIHDYALNSAHSVQNIQKQIKPKEIELQFAVKVDSELGILIAKSSMEAQLQVRLK